MKLNCMAEQTSGWIKEEGPLPGIVISSRIRLARNLSEFPFPSKSRPEELLRIRERVASSVEESDFLKGALLLKLEDIDSIDRLMLLERHLISYDHTLPGEGKGLVIGDREIVSVMINEEDHIRMQGMDAGFKLYEQWQILSQIDNQLESSLKYAFSSQLGYLTACPTNTGTGMRASVIMHLVGLELTEKVKQVLNVLSKVGVVARGFYGEGSRVMGNLFQISNQVTLGLSEETIINGLEGVIKKISASEEKVRSELWKQARIRTEDMIYRAWGILGGARRLTSQEAMDLISKVKLGLYLRIPLKVSASVLNEILLITQPAHLQETENRELAPEERDEVRARIIRKKLFNSGG